MPVIRQEIDLHTNDAQSLLPHFLWASTALYKLGITMRGMVMRGTTTEEKVAEIEGVVFGEILQPLEENLRSEIARVNLLYKECGQQPTVKFTHPLHAPVDLSSPDAKRLLDLLVGLDEMYRQLADLWFAKQIKNDAYVEVRTNCRNALKEAEKRIDRLVRQAMRMAAPQAEAKPETPRENKEASAEPATTEAPQSALKTVGRKARKAADSVAPATETPEPDKEKSPETLLLETGAVEGAEESTLSPFAGIQ
jgi:hypothetical protein